MRRVRTKSLLLSLTTTMSITGLLLYQYKVKVDTAKLYTEPLVNVVVAVLDIKANSIIEPNEVKVVTIPKKLVVSGSLNNKDEIIGKVASENIYAGEQILQERIVQNRDKDGLSAVIPKGYRAITIKVDMISSVGGKVKTGDYVDILVYLKPPYSEKEIIKTVFQNVSIIDVSTPDNSSSGGGYLTLCMTPEDSEKLFLLNKLGEIRLVLKPISDRNPVTIPPIGSDSI